jgi:hypothetical protein
VVFGAIRGIAHHLALATLVDEELRHVEVTPFAGGAVKLDKRHLNLGMAASSGALAGPEHSADVIGKTTGDVQQAAVARGSEKGYAGLEEMAGTI